MPAATVIGAKRCHGIHDGGGFWNVRVADDTSTLTDEWGDPKAVMEGIQSAREVADSERKFGDDMFGYTLRCVAKAAVTSA